MRWVALVAAFFSSLGWCQAPPLKYFVQFTPKIFGMVLPASGAVPERHCYLFVRQGGLYDAEVACYVGGVFRGRLETAGAGEDYDGGFRHGGASIRWVVCNPAAAVVPCRPVMPAPAGSTNLMYYELSADLGDGSPSQFVAGYY